MASVDLGGEGGGELVSGYGKATRMRSLGVRFRLESELSARLAGETG